MRRSPPARKATTAQKPCNSRSHIVSPHHPGVRMVNQQKILHALERCAPDGHFSVVRARNPSRKTGVQRTISSDNTHFVSGRSKLVGQSGGFGAELLACGASQKLVEIIVL